MGRGRTNEGGEKIGRILANVERAAEDRQLMQRTIERMDARIEPLLALPQRMTDLEKVASANHSSNVQRLAAIEKDVGNLKGWREGQAGARRGTRAFWQATIIVVNAAITALGIWFNHPRAH